MSILKFHAFQYFQISEKYISNSEHFKPNLRRIEYLEEVGGSIPIVIYLYRKLTNGKQL